jgi:hypothetical protein
MPRIRNEELFCILTHLRDMQLEPGVLPTQEEDSVWRTFPTAHLFKLYPALVDLLGVLSGSAWVAALGTEGGAAFDEGDLVDLSRACLSLVGRDFCA